MTPQLPTLRLVLKPYVPADEDAFVQLFSDPTVTRWMGMPSVDARTMFRRGISEPERITWDIWAVWENESYVGHAEIKPSPEPRVPGQELVYALLPSAWGRGLGSEVAEAVTTYGLETLALDHVYATVDAQNEKSLTLLEKLGYVRLDDWVDEDDPSGMSRVVLLGRSPNRS